MAYLLKSHNKIVSIETSKTLTRSEREAITAQLCELHACSTIQGLIIDHRKAEFDMMLEDAAIFAESIIKLNSLGPLLFICVIVSEQNRFIIDASVALAANRGVPIRVYECKNEAWKDIAQQFPQLKLPAPNGKFGGNVAPQSFRQAATKTGFRTEDASGV